MPATHIGQDCLEVTHGGHSRHTAPTWTCGTLPTFEVFVALDEKDLSVNCSSGDIITVADKRRIAFVQRDLLSLRLHDSSCSFAVAVP